MSGLSMWNGFPQELQGQTSWMREPGINQNTFYDLALEVRVTYPVLQLWRLSWHLSYTKGGEIALTSWWRSDRVLEEHEGPYVLLWPFWETSRPQSHHLATKIHNFQGSKIHSFFPTRTHQCLIPLWHQTCWTWMLSTNWCLRIVEVDRC